MASEICSIKIKVKKPLPFKKYGFIIDSLYNENVSESFETIINEFLNLFYKNTYSVPSLDSIINEQALEDDIKFLVTIYQRLIFKKNLPKVSELIINYNNIFLDIHKTYFGQICSHNLPGIYLILKDYISKNNEPLDYEKRITNILQKYHYYIDIKYEDVSITKIMNNNIIK